jgi:DNA modification methylase
MEGFAVKSAVKHEVSSLCAARNLLRFSSTEANSKLPIPGDNSKASQRPRSARIGVVMAVSPIAIEWVPLARLHLSPRNPRVNDDAIAPVAASIRRFGFQQPLVAMPSGEVIAGNTRLKAATSLGLVDVPVIWFEGSELDAKAYQIADNKTHEFATWNNQLLADLLGELRAEDALEGVGFDAAAIDELLAQLELDGASGQPVEDPGPGEVPESPVSARGEVWLLGRHRLMCGDSTSAEDMATLMAGQRASLFATDPPYLVDYRGGNHPQSWSRQQAIERGEQNDTADKHWDDYVDPQTGVAFFTDFLRAALAHCIERVPIYQWHATRRQGLVEEAWKANGLLVHQTIIWRKSRAVLTRSHYMWQHEPAFYGWPEGFMPDADRRPPPNEKTVWDIDQIGQQDGIHPTQKPVDIFARPIEYHTRPNEICLESFSGSGTQIIAAETAKRRCFAMELAPAYVDVAIVRWQKATGKLATREADGMDFDDLAAERGAA